MSQVVVVIALPAHAEKACNVLIRSIKEICAADYGYDKNILDKWLSNKTADNVRKWILSKDNYSIVAINSLNEIVGFSLISLPGEILLNYVLPEYKNKGVGKKLLAGLESFAKSADLSEITVVSTITAKSFYERNGFEKQAEPLYTGNLLSDFPLIKKI